MDNEFIHESQDIVIGNDCGRFVVSVKVEVGSNDMVTLPVAVWNYGAIVSALIRSRYSENEVEAIMRNLLGKKMDAENEFEALNTWCNQCKTRAAYLMNLGEKEYDLVSEEWQERCKATLEKAKKEKLAAILAYDTSDKVNGFILNGMLIPWSKNDPNSPNVEKRMGLRQNIADKVALGEKNISIWLKGMSFTMPCAQAEVLMRSIENYAYECFNVTAAHKKAVSELTTIEEVEAYDYKAGYPKMLEMSVE